MSVESDYAVRVTITWWVLLLIGLEAVLFYSIMIYYCFFRARIDKTEEKKTKTIVLWCKTRLYGLGLKNLEPKLQTHVPRYTDKKQQKKEKIDGIMRFNTLYIFPLLLNLSIKRVTCQIYTSSESSSTINQLLSLEEEGRKFIGLTFGFFAVILAIHTFVIIFLTLICQTMCKTDYKNESKKTLPDVEEQMQPRPVATCKHCETERTRQVFGPQCSFCEHRDLEMKATGQSTGKKETPPPPPKIHPRARLMKERNFAVETSTKTCISSSEKSERITEKVKKRSKEKAPDPYFANLGPLVLITSHATALDFIPPPPEKQKSTVFEKVTIDEKACVLFEIGDDVEKMEKSKMGSSAAGTSSIMTASIKMFSRNK
ncbi:unnamed protein product [Caenorhabditis sp. 36 PRJEB53466]|nr:unnamed protein product [Caenorhabditis sp. 36 PRJEB53466]